MATRRSSCLCHASDRQAQEIRRPRPVLPQLPHLPRRSAHPHSCFHCDWGLAPSSVRHYSPALTRACQHFSIHGSFGFAESSLDVNTAHARPQHVRQCARGTRPMIAEAQLLLTGAHRTRASATRHACRRPCLAVTRLMDIDCSNMVHVPTLSAALSDAFVHPAASGSLGLSYRAGCQPRTPGQAVAC